MICCSEVRKKRRDPQRRLGMVSKGRGKKTRRVWCSANQKGSFLREESDTLGQVLPESRVRCGWRSDP